LETDMNML